jgi:hypothetical protein
MATGKKNSGDTKRSKVPNPREQRLAPARHALRALDAGDFAEVVLEELNRRCFDFVNGRTTAPPGAYEAASAAVLATLGVPLGQVGVRGRR